MHLDDFYAAIAALRRALVAADAPGPYTLTVSPKAAGVIRANSPRAGMLTHAIVGEPDFVMRIADVTVREAR